ncbi:MAG: hypothetical protein L3J41_01295 [Melioribacteraceae bacterium]|nr:hypothetical protein [Melioribacteraceae bacterium]
MFNNLDVSLRDKAEYLRGLMIVLKIGNKLSNRERSYLLREAIILGYDETYCRKAMDELLINDYIRMNPAEFENEETCKLFIFHGIELASLNEDFLLSKNEWLLNVCLTNQIKYEWFVYCNNIFYSDNIPKSNYLLTA